MRLSGITERERYTEFHFSGAVDRATVLAGFREVHGHCAEKGLEAALVDLTATTGTVGSLDRIELARTLASEWTRTIALAVVVNTLQHLPERPAQLAAQNRGMRTREFTSLDSAAAWIKSTLE